MCSWGIVGLVAPLQLGMEEVYGASWRPATQLGDTWQGLTGFHLEQGAARKTSICTWDVGVIALQ